LQREKLAYLTFMLGMMHKVIDILLSRFEIAPERVPKGSKRIFV